MAERLGNRAAVFIVRDRSILLLHRIRNGEVYHAVPGGTIEEGESPRDAAVREIREEAGLVVEVQGPVLTLANQGRTEFYFDATVIQGTPELGGPEAEHNSPANHYELETVPLSDLETRSIRPGALKEWMLNRDWGVIGS